MFKELDIAGKQIRVYPAKKPHAPAVYLNTIEPDCSEVRRRCFDEGCPDFTFVSVSGLRWNDELTPWPHDCITRSDAPYAGEAQGYLRDLTEEIMPAVEQEVGGKPSYSALAGYSLGGLFALWASFHTDAFSRVISASGSLWYPGFVEYARAHSFSSALSCVYLSLGKKEHRTPNRLLRNVRANTQDILELCRNRGVLARLDMNPGNHFQDVQERMAKGIAWTLRQG